MKNRCNIISLLFFLLPLGQSFAVVGNNIIREGATDLEINLGVAAFQGDVNTVNFLLESGISPNLRCINSQTRPMMILLCKNMLENIQPGLTTNVLKALISAPGFNPNLRNDNGETLLFLAIKGGCGEIINLLLNFPGIDINATNSVGETILHYIVRTDAHCTVSGRRIIEKLLEHPRFSLELLEAKDSQGKTVKNILEIHTKMNIILSQKLDEVLQKKQEEAIQENSVERQLCDAIVDGNLETIKELIQKNPDLNVNWQDKERRTLLMHAIATGSFEVIQTLLDLCPNIDFDLKDCAQKTALNYAESNHDNRVIETLKKAINLHENSEENSENPSNQNPREVVLSL
ncbi:MAG: ankyrin repeat domain-containing protein [Puniceicoccales bacterium]|jgi:ankyrin repeat protein|nr:ankyrin repeat domain-containing protein [Puniceicoccales bacterium]